MLRDRDADVVMNAIYALEEILEEEGGMATNPALIRHLLSRLSEFNEWHQILVLRIVYREYVPSTEEEVFQLMVGECKGRQGRKRELIEEGNRICWMNCSRMGITRW